MNEDSKSAEPTAAVYDRAAPDWARSEPVLLSDYTARPAVLAACEPVQGCRVLDLGCGEGYVARRLAVLGAAKILAFDVSEGMIARAREAERAQPLGITYQVGDATAALPIEEASFDLVVAVFLFNYLDRAETTKVMRAAWCALRPGGRFVYTVPHPALPFLRRPERPFGFDRGAWGYFSGRDVRFDGRIWRRDGVELPVRCVHKTFADYVACMREAGFAAMPRVTELGVTPSHLALDPAFFGPLAEQPLHVMFELVR